jgi:hypothetical protein
MEVCMAVKYPGGICDKEGNEFSEMGVLRLIEGYDTTQ